MKVVQDIKLNINDTGNYYIVTVKQGDTGRWLNVTFMDDNTEITIPSTATPSVRVLKADGTSVDDTCTVSGGKVMVELTEQITAVDGYAKADVSVAHDGEIVSTATFLIKVGAVPLGVEIVSENEFTQLSALIASASQYETRIATLEEGQRIIFGTCGTASSTATKVVAGTNLTQAEMNEGNIILVVQFDYENTAAEPSLSVNGVAVEIVGYADTWTDSGIVAFKALSVGNSIYGWQPINSDHAYLGGGYGLVKLGNVATQNGQEAFTTGGAYSMRSYYDGQLLAKTHSVPLGDGIIGMEDSGVAMQTYDTTAIDEMIEPLQDNPKIWYGSCSTGISTTEKVVTCEGFSLREGDYIIVQFAQAINNSSIKLNVNNVGAWSVSYKASGKMPLLPPCRIMFRVRYYSNLSEWYYDVVGEVNALPNATGNKLISTDQYGRFVESNIPSTVDNTPTADSANLVTSGGVASAIQGAHELPSMPSTDGSYYLKITVTDGAVTKEWERVPIL